MTTIINKYVGITHPVLGKGLTDEEYDVILQAWKRANCPDGIHLFDEVWTNHRHVLHCDACGIEVYISKIYIPDEKDDVIT